MSKTNTWFKFEPISNWDELSENGRLSFRSPKGEILMISSAGISGTGNEGEIQDALENLWQNALTSAAETIEHTDLKITRELKRDVRVSGIECWTIEAETIDGQEIYFKSIFRNGMGVLFVTLEAYNIPASRMIYETFIKSVESNLPQR